MTDAIVQVPPDSTGKRLAHRSYLRGADTVLSQGVYFDALPSFGMLCEGTTLGNNVYHAYLRNDTGSAQTLWLIGLHLINLQTAAITGGASRFDFRRVTGTPTMTAVTPYPYNTTQTLTGVTGGRAVTAGLTDAQILRPCMFSSDEHTASAANVQQFADTMNWLPALNPNLRPMALRPGEAVALKQATAVTTGALGVLIHFSTEPD